MLFELLSGRVGVVFRFCYTGRFLVGLVLLFNRYAQAAGPPKSIEDTYIDTWTWSLHMLPTYGQQLWSEVGLERGFRRCRSESGIGKWYWEVGFGSWGFGAGIGKWDWEVGLGGVDLEVGLGAGDWEVGSGSGIGKWDWELGIGS